jgi:hypothetical protein
LALFIVLAATLLLHDEPREVAHIIGAAMLPAVAPTLAMNGIGTDFLLIERTLPQRLRVWDVVLLLSVSAATAAAIGWLMGSSSWSADYALDRMVVRTATFGGLLLLVGAVLNPTLAWIVSVVVLAATLRPFLQTPNLIANRPTDLFWWPTLPADGRMIILAIVSLTLGSTLYIAAPRLPFRRWGLG